MKRELKDPLHSATAKQLAVTEIFPMKRELKVDEIGSLERSDGVTEIFPMKRELKDGHYPF